MIKNKFGPNNLATWKSCANSAKSGQETSQVPGSESWSKYIRDTAHSSAMGLLTYSTVLQNSLLPKQKLDPKYNIESSKPQGCVKLKWNNV